MSSSDLNLSDFFDFSLYYAKDYSPPEITPTTNENLSIRQSLETYTSSLNPDCFPDSELTRNNYSSMDLDVLENQHYTTPTHWDGIAGFFPPLHSDIILDIPKPFDGEISVKDTYTADIQRYMKRTGKVPNVNVFTSEDDDVECVSALALSLMLRIFMNISPLVLSSLIHHLTTFPPIFLPKFHRRPFDDKLSRCQSV